MLQTPTPRLPGWEWRPVRYRTRVNVFEHLTRWQVIHAGVSRKTNQDHKCMRPTQSKSRSIKIEIFSKGSEETGPFVFSVPENSASTASAQQRRMLKKNGSSLIPLLMRKEGLRFQAWKDLRGTAERVRKTKSERLFYYRPRRTPWRIYTGHSTCSDLLKKVYQKGKLRANFGCFVRELDAGSRL